MKRLFVFLVLVFSFTFCFTMTRYDIIKGIREHYQTTKYKDVSHIITAMLILETGWFKSKIHQEYKNFYSVKRKWTKECNAKPILCMRKFKTLKESHVYMTWFFNDRGYRTSEKEFFIDLKKLGYAEDPEYVNKVKAVLSYMKRKEI